MKLSVHFFLRYGRPIVWQHTCSISAVNKRVLRMKPFFLRAVISIALLTSSLAFGQSNIAPDLLQLITHLLGNTRVIVQFQSAPTSLQLLQIQLLGGKIKTTYSLIPA